MSDARESLRLARKPTQRTIAEITGLAVTTVSRALAGDEKIAERTRAQVAEVAREIGYVPDRAAQRLRTGRSNVIALVLDPHSEILGFSSSMISGISGVLHDTTFHLVLMQYAIDEPPMDPIRRIVRNRLADGLILARTEPQDPRVAYLMRTGFPFVTHGRTEMAAHPWLDYDNAAFARMAVERLVGAGRRRLALVAPAPKYSFNAHMREGFRAAVAAHGVTGLVAQGFTIHDTPGAITCGVREMAQGAEAPDGWICPGEIAAMAVQAGLTDCGQVIGRDVDLVAKQTSEVGNLFRPRLTAIYEDIEEAGRRLAQLLLARIRGEDPAALHHLQIPVWAGEDG
ncbi:LacI family transcriptional regulator [Ovoidimarina sediminis]|uniref:LacI family transcriptional regulator n=1 Tax=Ovoidimarina sediminis TaxID=3079856 RepID=UPI0029121DDE|nr:LacI family transcriptional regulator [Rhodophyticola sp. MJ-SS7]MDU8944066.1 LacI family transcriptional regulator [Rhodophyticola sp. MJ-SS7]